MSDQIGVGVLPEPTQGTAMVGVSLVISGLLLGAMVGISWYGPVAGAVIFALLAVVSEYVIRANDRGARQGPFILLPFVLLVLAVGQWGAIAAARRNTTVRSDQ